MMISNGVGIIFGGLGALTYGYFAVVLTQVVYLL